MLIVNLSCLSHSERSFPDIMPKKCMRFLSTRKKKKQEKVTKEKVENEKKDKDEEEEQ